MCRNETKRRWTTAYLKRLVVMLCALMFVFPGLVNGEIREAATLDEVVVTADRFQEYIKDHPQDIENIGRKVIEERNLTTLEDILKTIPGVQVYSTPGRGSRISIRGSGKTGGVLLMLDGRPLNANQYGAIELDSIPADIIESVTVFKPPIPSWLGPGGSDGVIYILTRSETVTKDSKEPRTSLKLGGGSFGLIEGSFTSKFSILEGSSFISMTGSHLDGKRTNSDKSEGSFNLNWNRELKGGDKVEINARYYHAGYGVPGPLDNPTPDARQEYRKTSIEGRYSGIVGQYGTYIINLYGDVINLKDRSRSGATYKLDNKKIGLKLDGSLFGEKNQWELRLGGMSEYDNIDHDLSGKHHRLRNGISSQLDRRFGRFTLTIGSRVDHTNDFGLNPGFSTGLGWGINEECIIKAKAGYTINVPSFEQLYQTSHGSIDQIRGNPNLKEEKVWSYSIGLEYKKAKENRRLEFTLFRADTKDLISYKRGTDLIYRPVNIESAYRYGLEFTGTYAFTKATVMELNAILQNSSNSETGGELPYTPRVKAKASMRHTILSSKTMLEGNIRYEGRRFSQIENLQTQWMEEFVVVDVKVSQPLKLGDKTAALYMNVYNLFDKRFEIHPGYPDNGIRFIVGCQIRL